MKYISALVNVISSNRTFRTTGGLADDVLLIVTGQPMMGASANPSISNTIVPLI